MRLTLVPFESASPDLVRSIAKRLRAVLPWKFVVAAVMPEPPTRDAQEALDVAKVLALLPAGARHDELAVGITARDLSTPDYASVLGYAEPERRVAVISLLRLAEGTVHVRGGRRRLVERAAKEVLHEAGHLLSLPHCEGGNCVMQYSQALHDTDIKPCRFCATCLKELSRLPEPASET
jgi:predicted Zn-dependent protease